MHVSLSQPLFNADGGGAAGAPGSSPFTGGGSSRPGQSRGQPSGGGSDEGSADSLLAELRAELEDARSHAARADQRSAGVEKTLGGLASVLGGKPEKESDWYEDEILPHLYQLDKNGKPHPMTAKIAQQVRKEQENSKSYAQAIAELKREIAELRDPQAQNDERAYGQIDDFLTNELTSVYGEAPTTLHRAVGANIAADLARVQKEFPHKWEEIRRNPEALKKIVKHHILTIIPPQAKQAIAKQVEDNTPVTLQTIESAWQEFQSLKHKMDPQMRSEVATELRQQLLAERYMQTRRMPQRR